MWTTNLISSNIDQIPHMSQGQIQATLLVLLRVSGPCVSVSNTRVYLSGLSVSSD